MLQKCKSSVIKLRLVIVIHFSNRYETIHDYNYNDNKIDSDKPYALMAAIMLWGETTRLGCAISRNRQTGEGFVVAMYAPGVSNHSPASYKKNLKRPKGYSEDGYSK